MSSGAVSVIHCARNVGSIIVRIVNSMSRLLVWSVFEFCVLVWGLPPGRVVSPVIG